jgi:hypothetical protein
MVEKLTHGRFKSAPWYPSQESETTVLVGGAGGIGSWTAMLLSRAGFKPMVYDFDMLELHNLGGQLYPKTGVGKYKVDVLREVLSDFCDDVIDISKSKIDEHSPTNVYVVSAFDNMQARKDMFNSWLQVFGESPDAIFIDGRLEAEQMFIYCVTSKNKDQYIKLLEGEDDKNIADAPCTMKQTSHAAAMIASHIVGFFTNHITNVVEQDDSRNVPFRWEYFIPMDLLDVQNS